MRTVATIAIDTYDSRGNLTGSVLGARASSVLIDGYDALHQITAALPAAWVQMTYDELVEHFGKTRGSDDTPWVQLSIF